MARRSRIEIDWEDVFDSRSSSPDVPTFYSGSAPAARPAAAAAAARPQIKIDWGCVFGTPSSSPDRLTFYHPGTAPAARAAAEDEGDEPRRGASSRPPHPWAEDLPCRIERGTGGRSRRHRAVPEAAALRPSIDAPAPAAAAKEDEHQEECSSASAAKRSRKLDTEKEDALLHMLGEINKSLLSLQASSQPAEPLQALKEAPPEEIFEALKGIPRLARSDQLRAYSMLTRDDRRFRSLMALPINMRKEWLLMEIGSI